MITFKEVTLVELLLNFTYVNLLSNSYNINIDKIIN